MDKEWVDKKSKEAYLEYQKQKEMTLQKLKMNDFMNNEEKEHALKLFNEEDYFGISLMTNYLYLTFEDAEGNSTQKSLECKRWNDSLQLEYLNYVHENGYRYDMCLDSEPVEFDGDIIITDPCYICKEAEEVGDYPFRSDFASYENVKDYPDCRLLTDDEVEQLDEIKRILVEIDPAQRYFSKQHEDEMADYEKAMEVYQAENISDWEKSNCGYDLDKIGITNYMTRSTLYGDWTCITYNLDTKEEIGEFCADAGLVSVMSLEEVLKYNPDFDYHINKTKSTTWIRDFKGTVQFVVKCRTSLYDADAEYHKKGVGWRDCSVEIIGHGVNKKTGIPINFIGTQTGL